MELIGEKIVLKIATQDYAEDFTRWMNDLEVTPFLGPVHGKKLTLEQEKKWLDGILNDPDELLFCIFKQDDGRLIGNCAIHWRQKCEDQYAGKIFLGIVIGEKDEWGNGYGKEAIRLMVDHAKAMGRDEVYLTVDCENERAQKAYQKCGFQILERRTKKDRKGEELVMMA